MNRYVLGFAFDQFNRVCLIRKVKPTWQAGKWNGVGGSIEPTDISNYHAMAREFWEETGVVTCVSEWRRFGFMFGDGWECDLYTINLFAGMEPETRTAEVVGMWTADMVADRHKELLANVPALISAACCGQDGAGGNLPFFTLDYTSKAKR